MKTKVLIWVVFILSSIGSVWAQKDLITSDINVTGVDLLPTSYTGVGVSPTVLGLTDLGAPMVAGTDYTLSVTLSGNAVTEFKHAGAYTVTFTAASAGYTGKKSINVTITAVDINGAIFSALSSKEFTGTAITPAGEISGIFNSSALTSPTDYQVSYSNNTNAGTATVLITGQGNFTGTRNLIFTITPVDISGAIFSALSSKAYTGTAITHQAGEISGIFNSYALTPSTDYQTSYSNNTNVGTATVLITGQGNFTGTRNLVFAITPADINSAIFSALPSKEYTGTAITHQASEIRGILNNYTLTSPTDYQFSYSNNTNVGTATVLITGQGNFTGTRNLIFTITPIDISSAVITLVRDTFDYAGGAIEPIPSVKLGSATLNPADYAVVYRSNTEAGIGSVIVVANQPGNLTGSPVSKTFVIVKPLTHAEITVTIPKQTYTGSPVVPAKITVLDKNKHLVSGTDYRIKPGSPLNNVDAGVNTASLILERVSGGVYTGETSRVYYTIEVGAPNPDPDPDNYLVMIPQVKGLITTPSAGTYNAPAGEDFVLTVEIDSIKRGLIKEGARKVKVLVNGDVVDATYLGNGAYRVVVEDLQNDITFELYLEDGNGSGVEGVNQTVKVYGGKGMLYIETVEPLRATVYSISGQLRLDKQVYESESFSLPQGIYITKVGDKTYKVIVK